MKAIKIPSAYPAVETFFIQGSNNQYAAAYHTASGYWYLYDEVDVHPNKYVILKDEYAVLDYLWDKEGFI